MEVGEERKGRWKEGTSWGEKEVNRKEGCREIKEGAVREEVGKREEG